MPSSATSTPDIFPLSLLVALPSSSPGTGQIGGRSDLVSEQVPRSGEVSDSDQVTTFECGELCLDEMTVLSELLDPGSDLHSQAPPCSGSWPCASAAFCQAWWRDATISVTLPRRGPSIFRPDSLISLMKKAYSAANLEASSPPSSKSRFARSSKTTSPAIPRLSALPAISFASICLSARRR